MKKRAAKQTKKSVDKRVARRTRKPAAGPMKRLDKAIFRALVRTQATRKQSHVMLFDDELALAKEAARRSGLKYGTWGRMTLVGAARVVLGLSKAVPAEPGVSPASQDPSPMLGRRVLVRAEVVAGAGDVFEVRNERNLYRMGQRGDVWFAEDDLTARAGGGGGADFLKKLEGAVAAQERPEDWKAKVTTLLRKLAQEVFIDDEASAAEAYLEEADFPEESAAVYDEPLVGSTK